MREAFYLSFPLFLLAKRTLRRREKRESGKESKPASSHFAAAFEAGLKKKNFWAYNEIGFGEEDEKKIEAFPSSSPDCHVYFFTFLSSQVGEKFHLPHPESEPRTNELHLYEFSLSMAVVMVMLFFPFQLPRQF